MHVLTDGNEYIWTKKEDAKDFLSSVTYTALLTIHIQTKRKMTQQMLY